MVERRTFCKGVALSLLAGATKPTFASLFHAENEFDVIVVGAGGAGLAAALTAAEAKARVLLIEKMGAIGGNTLRASGLFNAADPERQARIGVKDSPQWHFEQMMKSGGGKGDPEVVRRFVNEALPTLHWLESLGIRFLPTPMTTWGAEWPRGHKPLQPRGQAYIRTMSSACIKLGVTIKTNTALTDLMTDDEGRVTGIRTVVTSYQGKHRRQRTMVYHAKQAVILTAGGFGANSALVAKYRPELSGIPTDNNPGNTGDVLDAAMRIGADTTGLSYIQCVPGAPEGRGFQVRLDLDIGRVVMLDANGRRFIDEDLSRGELANAILKHPKGSVWTLTDNASVNAMDQISRKDIYRGLQTGDSIRADSLEEIATQMGLPVNELTASIRQFNDEVAQGVGKCGRVKCCPINTPPYWASRVILNVHSTMGGLVITPDAEVKDKMGKVIPGLFAAGEITGSVHGENRMGGNGIADAITFGRIAGKAACRLKPS